jgi:hypothetical protein
MLKRTNLDQGSYAFQRRNLEDDVDEENGRQSFDLPLNGDIESAGSHYRFHTILLGDEGSSHSAWTREEWMGKLALVYCNRLNSRTVLPFGGE